MRLGEWDEATALVSSIVDSWLRDVGTESVSLLTFAESYVHRGQLEEFEKLVSVFEHMGVSDDMQERSMYLAARACLRRAKGDFADSLADADEAISTGVMVGGAQQQSVKTAFVEAVESAFSLDDRGKVQDLIAWVDGLNPGERPPSLRAEAARFRARLDGTGDPAAVESAFAEAEEIFNKIGLTFSFAVTELEHAEWLIANSRRAEAAPTLADATRTFERLQARPWLERAMVSAPAAGVTLG
jgi:hypothetical protein